MFWHIYTYEPLLLSWGWWTPGVSFCPFVIPPFHPSSCPVPRQLLIHFLSPLFSLHFLEFYKHGIFSNVASFIQHILRFIRLCISYSFLFIAVESCCINMLQFIHWLIHEHLGCPQRLNASFLFIWVYTCRDLIDGSFGKSALLEELPNSFHSGNNNVHSHQKCIKGSSLYRSLPEFIPSPFIFFFSLKL